MRLIKAVVTISGYTALSRVLGLVREILMSYVLGAGLVTDAFLVAFKFPNFFRRLFAEGALHAAFVPTFSDILVHEGQAAARKAADNAFSFLVWILLLLTILVLIFTPFIVPIIAPGFVYTPERMQLATDFTRLTFPYIFFVSLTVLLTGILNALHRFAVGAAAPIVLNITMISALICYPFLEITAGYALAAAVLVAGGLQFSFLYLACWKQGFALKLGWPKLTPAVREIMRLMGPGAFGAGVMQFNLLFDMFLASLLPPGSISYLYYADRLNQLPLSIFGIAIGTALLPKLSYLLSKKEVAAVIKAKESSIEIALLLSMPAAIGLIVLAHPIIALIYGHGHFGSTGVDATAPALAAFAVGLPAYVLTKVFIAHFFARRDTKTLVSIGIRCVLINIFLNLILMSFLLHVGMALATSITAWVQVVILLRTLKKKADFIPSPILFKTFARIAAMTLFTGAGLWGAKRCFSLPAQSSLAYEIIYLTCMIGVGIIIFYGLGYWCKAFDVKRLRQDLKSI